MTMVENAPPPPTIVPEISWGVPCPHCNHRDSMVKDSRPRTEAIHRRRECLRCGERFSTTEIALGDIQLLTPIMLRKQLMAMIEATKVIEQNCARMLVYLETVIADRGRGGP